MQSTFRVAIGPCSCAKIALDSPDGPICQELLRRLATLRSGAASDLAALPQYSEVDSPIGGRSVQFQTIRESLVDGEFLVILRAMFRTWRRPNWISLGCIGRMYAHGLIVRSNGMVEDAPDEHMWEFR